MVANNTRACDDGDACTQIDTCAGGVCAGASPLSCADEGDVPGGLCRADSCLDNTDICGEGFDCSYSSDSRYVCAVGPSNYLGVCGEPCPLCGGDRRHWFAGVRAQASARAG